MNHQQIKQTFKKVKPLFPLPVQQWGSQAWRAVELPLASLVERRALVDVQRVVWPAAEVADFEQAQILGPAAGDVLVDVAFSVVSPGTERAQLLGLPGVLNHDEMIAFYPGYSGSGRVLALGRGVTAFRVGDRVAGRISHASRCTVAASRLFPVPATVHLADAAFIELGIIALQGVRKARIRPGESVCVLGQGLVGQLAARLSRVAGASPVIAVARTRAKAAAALRPGGADRFLTVDELADDALAADGFDVVIDATGSAQIVPLACSLARAAEVTTGRVIGLGTPHGSGTIPLGQRDIAPGVTFSGAHISGIPAQDRSDSAWPYRAEGGLWLDLLAEGRILPRDLVSERADPAQAGRVYAALKRRDPALIGILFDWQAAAGSASSAPADSLTHRSTP